MIAHEIVWTCSNPHVADAAIASIGGAFAGWVNAEATRRRLSTGQLAASFVREFRDCALDDDWQDLRAAIRGAEMPILSGLRYILEHEARMTDESSAGVGGMRSGVEFEPKFL